MHRGTIRILALALVAGFVAAMPVAASRTDSDLSAAGLVQIDEADTDDTLRIAKAHGWTVDQVTAYMVGAQVVGEIATQVASEWPDLFAGSEVALEPNGPPTLYLKGGVTAEIRALVDRAAIELIVVDHQPFSFAELHERNVAAHRALVDLGFDYVSSGAPIAGGGQVVAWVLRNSRAPETAAEILDALPAEIRSFVAVTVSDRPTSGKKAAFGGMRVLDDGVAECSSGFSVRRLSDGLGGVVTAGHCTGINQIDHPGHGVHSTHLVQQHRGNYGDVEWHITNQSEPNQFFIGPWVTRVVNAIEAQSAISVNELICTYSLYSQPPEPNCTARVDQPKWGCTSGGVTMHQFVLMDRVVATYGDSGAPWWVNSRAYGSTYGECDSGPFNQELFSVADLYDEALKIKVKTAP